MRGIFGIVLAAVFFNPAIASDFGGRVTPTPGQAFIGARDVTSQTLAYSPVPGGSGKVPIFDGTVMAPREFLMPDTDQTGPVLNLNGSATWPLGELHDVFLKLSAGAGSPVIMGTGPAWSNQPSFYTLIPNAGCANIGTGTGLEPWYQRGNAFNGNISQPYTASAMVGQMNGSNLGLANYLGCDYGGAPQAIARFTIYAPSDDYLIDSGLTPLTQITLDFSDDCATWTNIFNNSVVANTIGASYKFDVGTWWGQHRCWRAGIEGDGANRVKVAQVTFSAAITAGREALIFKGGALVNAAAMALQTAADVPPINCPPYECTVVALAKISDTAPGTIKCLPSYGLNRECGISNIANEATICLKAGEPILTTQAVPASYQYQMPNVLRYVFAPAHGNLGNSLSILSPWPKHAFEVKAKHTIFQNTQGNGQAPYPLSVFWSSINRDKTGLNSSAAQPCGFWGNGNDDHGNIAFGQTFEASCLADPFAGIAKFTSIENAGINPYGGSGTVSTGMGYNGTRGNMILSACFPY